MIYTYVVCKYDKKYKINAISPTDTIYLHYVFFIKKTSMIHSESLVQKICPKILITPQDILNKFHGAPATNPYLRYPLIPWFMALLVSNSSSKFSRSAATQSTQWLLQICQYFWDPLLSLYSVTKPYLCNTSTAKGTSPTHSWERSFWNKIRDNWIDFKVSRSCGSSRFRSVSLWCEGQHWARSLSCNCLERCSGGIDDRQEF